MKSHSQASIARALGLSPASVTKCKAMGMPTDTVENAFAWRQANITPTAHRLLAKRSTIRPTLPAQPPRAVAYATDDEVEVMADLVNGALARGSQDVAATRIGRLRELLSQSAPGAEPRLTLRVWLVLLVYMLHEDAEIRHAPDIEALLTPSEFGARVCKAWSWPANFVIYSACDFDNHSIIGWPDGEGDDDPE